MEFKSNITLGATPTDENHAARLREALPALMTRDELGALKVGDKYPSLARRTVVVTDEDSAEASFGAMRPDYSRNENITGSYTESVTTADDWSSLVLYTKTIDRTGYIFFRFDCTPQNYAQGHRRQRVSVNGREVFSSSNQDLYLIGTLIPVSAGDVVRAHLDTVLKVTWTVYLECQFYPPKLVSLTAPVESEEVVRTAVVPDYTKMEQGTNLLAGQSPITIDTLTASWQSVLLGEVPCQRTGYLYLVLNSWNLGVADSAFSITVNNRGVASSHRPGLSNGIAYSPNPVPVKAGDTLRVRLSCVLVSSGTGTVNITDMVCHFIPPAFVTVQAPNIISPLPSYSTQEQVTGETWIDGKPIYRKVVPLGNLPNNTSVLVPHGITTLDTLISCRGLIRDSANNDQFDLPLISPTSMPPAIIIFVRGSNIYVGTGQDRTTCLGYAILHYTKAA